MLLACSVNPLLIERWHKGNVEEVDIGCWLMPAGWGAGLATEAAQAAIGFGFDRLKLPRIIGMVDPGNRGSIRVLEKLGMTKAGTIQYGGDECLKFVLDRGPREGSSVSSRLEIP